MRLEPSDTRRPAPWRVLAASLAGLACIPAYAALIGDMPGIAQPLPALIGVFLAAYASAAVGFAFSTLCVPILALAGLDALTMVQTLMLCSIAIYGWSTFVLRRDLDFHSLAPLLLGGLCALPFGVWLLLRLPEGSPPPAWDAAFGAPSKPPGTADSRGDIVAEGGGGRLHRNLPLRVRPLLRRNRAHRSPA
jgi:hypothetical protein